MYVHFSLQSMTTIISLSFYCRAPFLCQLMVDYLPGNPVPRRAHIPSDLGHISIFFIFSKLLFFSADHSIAPFAIGLVVETGKRMQNQASKLCLRSAYTADRVSDFRAYLDKMRKNRLTKCLPAVGDGVEEFLIG